MKLADMNEVEIICRYNFTIFTNDSFRICKYEYTTQPDDANSRFFVAKGNDIPEVRNVDITLHGRWKSKGKDREFIVSAYSVSLPKSEEGITEYLVSLKCGVGKTRAKALYKHFGENLWFIIENRPESLAEAGLDNFVSKKLIQRLQETRSQMKIMQMFRGTNITLNKVNKLINRFGSSTLSVLEDNPYAICQVDGFSFMLADSLAMEKGIDPTNINRRKAAAVAALDTASVNGHVCLPRQELVGKMMRLLNANRIGAVTEDMCEAAIVTAISDKMIATSCGFVYTIERYYEEVRIAKELFRLMDADHEVYNGKVIDEAIAEYEKENGISMADSQKDAVRCVMNNQVSILTGGPGTGKSTTAKAILYCHRLLEQNSLPILLSPTGKAARRLSESTEYPASTINSGIRLDYLQAESNPTSETGENQFLEGNIILVDESSMADQHITCELVRRIRTGAKLVFIGDPNQLPSVGCGNVLYELIRSQAIPTVALSVIFRQAQENPIVANAAKVLAGETSLDYSNNSFSIMPMADPGRIFIRAANMYVQSVRKYGIESTILLCPYRKSTELNVNLFNIKLQEVLNPKKPGATVMKGRSVFISAKKSVPLEFRLGDKVMMTVNTHDAKNGDTGFIRSFAHENDRLVARVEFNGSGELVSFDSDKIRDLDLAYCSSVHKSQGEEYKTVILVCSSIHQKMLKRNLFYTAITRAKENVLLVGEEESVKASILDNNIDQRYTLLSSRLHSLAKKRIKVA